MLKQASRDVLIFPKIKIKKAKGIIQGCDNFPEIYIIPLNNTYASKDVSTFLKINKRALKIKKSKGNCLGL